MTLDRVTSELAVSTPHSQPSNAPPTQHRLAIDPSISLPSESALSKEGSETLTPTGAIMRNNGLMWVSVGEPGFHQEFQVQREEQR